MLQEKILGMGDQGIKSYFYFMKIYINKNNCLNKFKKKVEKKK